MMKTKRGLWMASALALALALGLGGCLNSDEGDGPVAVVVPPPPVVVPPPPVVVTEVPDSAGASISAFFAFILALSQTNETGEPLTLKDSFTVPADETSEPQAII